MISLTDNGFYIYAGGRKIKTEDALRKLINMNIRDVLLKAIDKTEILSRRFRHCATRSLMILRKYKGRKKSVGKQQIGSKILMNLVKRISDNFPILVEAKREVIEDFMDVEHAEYIIKLLRENTIKVEYIFTDVPSPFAFNLIAQGYMDILKMEDRLEFIKRMHQIILKRIGKRDIDILPH